MPRTQLRLLALCGLLAAAHPLAARTWTQTLAPSNYWASVASSADGSHLVAVAGGGSSASPIYTSTNSGGFWTSNSLRLDWSAVASSADGTRLAAAEYTGSIYTSTNSGATWWPSGAPTLTWRGLASSADGTRLLAAAFGNTVYLSTNSGASWDPFRLGFYSWQCAACSADGHTLVVGRADSSFRVYASTNDGATWTTNILAFYCMGVAASADGTHLAAVCLGNGVYTSTNSGMTWAPTSAPGRSWRGVASSADGSHLAAFCFNGTLGEIYTSADAGLTWTSNNLPSESWTAVASSADGAKLAATASQIGFTPGPIFAAQSSPSPVLNPALSQGQLGLSWIVPSANLVLEQSSGLDPDNWSVLTNTPSFDPTTLRNTIFLSPSTSSGFYRLAIPP